MTFILSKWFFIPAAVLLIITALLALLYFFQDRIIFYPRTITPDQAEEINTTYSFTEEVFFDTDDGKTLHGWLVHRAENNLDHTDSRLLIYYGGNAEELSAQIPLMADLTQEWSVLLINYRGYGKSEGNPSEKALYNDALMIYDEIAANNSLTFDKTVVMGRSIGTAPAINTAAARYTDGVILISPFDSMTEVARHHYPFLPVSWLLRYNFDSAKRINDISSPMLVIAGVQDQIIPVERTEALLRKTDKDIQFTLMSGRNHNNIHMDPRYKSEIRNFLDSVK